MASAAAWEGPTAAELKAAGAEAIPGGVRVEGWVIQSHKGPILNAASLQLFEDELQTTHLPEMIFGESSLSLQHIQTGIKLHLNALDALKGQGMEKRRHCHLLRFPLQQNGSSEDGSKFR